MRSIYTFISLLILCHLGWSQTTLSGTVTDIETGEPIFGANVFIVNSTVGATSDPDGKYEILNIRGSYQKVVVSHLSYENKTVSLNGRTSIDFKLKPSVRQLEGVEIEQKKDRKWSRLYKQFEEAFIGKTKNAPLVTIKNPWLMELNKGKSDQLTGHSLDLLEIENRATGYRLDFLVENFKQVGEETTYGGKPLFTPLKASSPEEQQRWEETRQKTYLGSKQHFLYALAKGRSEQEGFLLYDAEFDKKTASFKTIKRVTPQDVYRRNTLAFSEFLKVVYTKEKPETAFVREFSSSTTIETLGYDRKLEQGAIRLEKRAEANSQVSYLFSRTSRGLTITDQGILKNPEYLLEYGYWGWERVAELLPYEYHLDFIESDDSVPELGVSSQMVAVPVVVNKKNSFEMANLKVPEDEIVVGVPIKDGIPSIDNPKFQEASSVDWLNNKSELLSVQFNGITKAYPIEIMSRHEVVNDDFDGKDIAITYCPLCGSGIAYEATVDEQPIKFGVSGLLYNSNVLLYDKSTKSLWSQIESKAITGEMAGKKLKPIPADHLTWKEWKERNPSGRVMTRETGYEYDYEEAVYQGYDETDEIPFPVKHKSSELSPKELTVGVTINGKHKAYALKKLKKNKGPLEDELGGKKIFITYFAQSNTAVIRDGNKKIIPSTRLYWFAWYAFHPDTELY